MKSYTRRAVAYIVGRLVSGGETSTVYDRQESRYVNISGTVTAGNVSVYDYDRGCHIGGSSTALYDYGDGVHISLQVKDMEFSGYDYSSHSHYSGKVSGKDVSVYDYGTSSYYNYSI